MNRLRETMISCVLLFISLNLLQSSAYTIYDARRLYDEKVANYTKQMRPIYNQSLPMNISVGFQLIGLKDFDEINEKITVTAVADMFWTDENMVWTPSSYGGMESMYVESDPFWTPPLIMSNSYDKLEKIGGNNYSIYFSYDGGANWYPGALFTAICSVDITYYPFDSQQCTFDFIPWGESKYRVMFRPGRQTVGLTYYTGSGAWDLTDSSIYQNPTGDGNGIVMKLYLKRKPLFVIVNMVIPIILLSVINILVFLIPIESGERVSFSITVLLALAVFLTIVGDNLPKISTPMAMLSYYLTGIVVMSVGIVITTIFSLRIYHKDPKHPLMPFCIKFVRLMRFVSLSRCVGSKKSKAIQVSPTPTPDDNTHEVAHSRNGQLLNGGSVGTRKHGQNNAQVPMGIEPSGWDSSRSDDRPRTSSGLVLTDSDLTDLAISDSDITWKDVSVAVDKVLLAVFFLTLFFLTLVSILRLRYNT